MLKLSKEQTAAFWKGNSRGETGEHWERFQFADTQCSSTESSFLSKRKPSRLK